MTRMIAIVGLVAATFAVAAYASQPAGFWTPAQAKTALLADTSGHSSVITVYVGEFAKSIWGGRAISTATCKGTGMQKKSAFQAFGCDIQWYEKSDISKTMNAAHLYTRVWSAGSVCASSRSIADCPVPPVGKLLPGDPRSAGPRSGLEMTKTASSLFDAAYRAAGKIGVNRTCQATTAFVYTCLSAGKAAGTVAFLKGKTAWSTKVTLTG